MHENKTWPQTRDNMPIDVTWIRPRSPNAKISKKWSIGKEKSPQIKQQGTRARAGCNSTDCGGLQLDYRRCRGHHPLLVTRGAKKRPVPQMRENTHQNHPSIHGPRVANAETNWNLCFSFLFTYFREAKPWTS
jgi:hypothetical protein